MTYNDISIQSFQIGVILHNQRKKKDDKARGKKRSDSSLQLSFEGRFCRFKWPYLCRTSTTPIAK